MAAQARDTSKIMDCGKPMITGARACALSRRAQHAPIAGRSKEGTLEFFRTLLAAFPDWHMTVEDLIAGGDKAVARVTVTGTHKGEFMGVPPTGTRAEVQLIDIMRFDGAGLVSEHWGVADMLSLLQQLGVVPAGPPA
jgi:predicted ester cyclase